MTSVYLALGSNVGDSKHNINQAVTLLSEKINSISLAPVYTSKAAGYTDQADFLNTAVGGQTELSPEELFGFTKDIEQQLGRIKRFQWGPREIDIDIIFYGNEVIKTPGLTIPHPRFQERDFVLKPLLDLNPELVDPLSNKPLSQLLNQLKPDQRTLPK